jgi:excisionase family DNA binding protein
MKRRARRTFGDDNDKILTTRMVADYLNCHLSTVYRLVNDGRIPYFKLGGDLRFEKSVIDEWIQRGGGARD